ncbi:MAG TPA: class I SAM-dependent methyltransferase, partial [Acidimicrobiales bacterium]|nr:class I SAM-dependent methyltransferase [Acidimicrobiales bacterium]
ASGLAARWYQHDLTVTPLPTGPADLLYARLVLAHLPGPDHVLSGWLEGLGPGGRLLVEETEEVVAGHPLLASYEEMAGSLVAHRGGELLLGRRLAAFEPAAGFAVVLNRVVRHPVPLAVAARLFAMNFRTWRHDPFITAGHPPSALQEMGVGLDALADGAAAGEVVFRIRQVAVERR